MTNPNAAANRLAALWKDKKRGPTPPSDDSVSKVQPGSPGEEGKAPSGISTTFPVVEEGQIGGSKPLSPLLEREVRASKGSLTKGSQRINGIAVEEGWAQSQEQVTAGADLGLLEFKRMWSPLLGPGLLSLCVEFYNHTVAHGLLEYETTGPKLEAVAQVGRRQITNLLTQLVKLGFIDRDTIMKNNRPVGLRIRFYPERRK